jgi:SOS-response transcriptional repressor LexA
MNKRPNRRPVADVLNELMLQADISDNQLARSTGVSQPTITRIRNGKSLDPDTASLEPLAAYFGVPLALLRGEEPAGGVAEPTAAYRVHQVPLVDWGTVESIVRKITTAWRADAREHVASPVAYNVEQFALVVKGDSMVGLTGGYFDGDIIIIDPTLEARHGDDVVVVLADGTALFRRLEIAPEARHLVALHPNYPNRVLAMPADATIAGVVVYAGRKIR